MAKKYGKDDGHGIFNLTDEEVEHYEKEAQKLYEKDREIFNWAVRIAKELGLLGLWRGSSRAIVVIAVSLLEARIEMAEIRKNQMESIEVPEGLDETSYLEGYLAGIEKANEIIKKLKGDSGGIR